jgi:putative PIG3 family NAD(P)H quinone oxidoreductase
MLAIAISQPGGPEVLRPVERPAPQPGPGEVLIRIAAAGVNRPDVLQRVGRYPPPAGTTDIPGLEAAGTVAALGPPIEGAPSRWQIGDAVCALLAGGGYAQYCVAPAPQCLPLPQGLEFIAGAAIPETYFTVWTNLFQRARLKKGETVLIHGGASGIGTTAIQLARACGATVYATAGSFEKCEACERLGAAQAINHRTMDFAVSIQELTSGRGVDVILDIVGADYLTRNLESLAVDGRLIQIGTLGGAKAEVNLATLMQRRGTITGSTLRIRSVSEKGGIARELEEYVWPLLAARRVAPVVHATLPLVQAADAHRLLESGKVIGKVVLVVTNGG